MLSDLVSVLLVPPVNLAVLAAIGVALSWRGQGRGQGHGQGRRPDSRPGGMIGRWLAALALALLLALALPVVSGSLLAALERGLPAAAPALPPQAIVILGGDVVPAWPDPAADARAAGAKAGDAQVGDAQVGDAQDIGALSLERLRAGAALQRATRLPVLITGGVLNGGREPVAVLMARSLRGDFGVPVRWVEPAARDTWENARRSAAMLRQTGIGTVYVVTHAWHMRRALIAFAGTGIVAVPAPLALDRPPRGRLGDFVPRVSSWQRGYFALHEWIGCAWYAWWKARQ